MLGNIGQSGLSSTEQILGDCHSPAQQIFQRSDSDDPREAVEEGGARHRSFPGEVRYQPLLGYIGVHQSKRWCQPSIGQAPQKPDRCTFVLDCTYRLNQQHFDKASENEISARFVASGFFADYSDQGRKPRRAAHVN